MYNVCTDCICIVMEERVLCSSISLLLASRTRASCRAQCTVDAAQWLLFLRQNCCDFMFVTRKSL